MLCETFARSDIGDAILAIDGYNCIVRQDGKDTEGGKCRGLLIYCRSELNASQFVGEGFNEVVECAGIQLPWGRSKAGQGIKVLKVVLVYRPPRSPFSDSDCYNTAKLCHMLKSLQGRVLVLGDFNLPGIDWEKMYSDSAGEKVVLDVIQGQFWTQHVNFTTHSGGNILDLVLSSSAELVHGVSDVGRLGDGDHSLLKVDVMGPAMDKNSMELVPDWTKADLTGIKEALECKDWEEVLGDRSGLQAWQLLRELIEEETEKHGPKKMRRVGPRPIWMSKNILRLIRKKRRLWRWFSKDGCKDHASFVAYKNVQREV